MTLLPLLFLLAVAGQDPPPQEEARKPQETEPPKESAPVLNRWRIPFPDYPLNEPGKLYDPYRQNPLKGDYPILGQNIFFSLTARSDTVAELRRVPTSSGSSTAQRARPDFFGDGGQTFINQDFAGTIEIFRGETSFRPRDWEIRATGVVNFNYLEAGENLVVSPDVGEETTRADRYAALQEALAEVHLLDLSDTYDFVSVRAGIQPFVSDFRGLMFSDTNLGVRLFGTLASNRVQWNVAFFNQLEKDTNSDLNTLHMRDQRVWIANLYVQDLLFLGYTGQVSVHVSLDDAGIEYDDNNVLVRPAFIGTIRPHDIDATYLGWTGDGHLGRLNLSHALYYAFGRDDFNQIAGRQVDIDAWLAALELSYDIDWIRLRGSVLWASGDRNPSDERATGFDSIFEAPLFAGGAFSYWNRQAIKLQGVNLVNRNSHLPDLRSSKTQGQLNFVNPGIVLLNAGLDVEVTQELKAIFNANLFKFHRTEPLKTFTMQEGISSRLGYEASLGLIGRPLLNNNVVVTLGASAFVPGDGFEDLYDTRKTHYSLFAQLTFVY